MEIKTFSQSGLTDRRGFLKNISTGVTSLALSSLYRPGKVFARAVKSEKSTVSFVTGNDHREATYQTLKPLEEEIKKAIGDKQVIIKINSGQIKKEWWLQATDPDSVRGILDFLKPVYNRKVIIAESTAAGAQSTFRGFENYGFMPLRKEYKVKFIDLNDQPATTKWILDGNRHPLGINIINTFLDPNVYMISATRLKTHNCVIATLSLKNIVIGSPINHFRQKQREDRNEKELMHSGGNRGLSYNMFHLAKIGIRPDLAVLDGVVGMENDGPVNGTPVEQGVALASTDWLAADRLGVELMGIDYNEVKYLQWCADAGMGQDDLSRIKVIGPDYTRHIIKYSPNKNIEQQREWLYEDFTQKE